MLDPFSVPSHCSESKNIKYFGLKYFLFYYPAKQPDSCFIEFKGTVCNLFLETLLFQSSFHFSFSIFLLPPFLQFVTSNYIILLFTFSYSILLLFASISNFYSILLFDFISFYFIILFITPNSFLFSLLLINFHFHYSYSVLILLAPVPLFYYLLLFYFPFPYSYFIFLFLSPFPFYFYH